jgi:DNA-binding NtrC family response regulator
MTGVVLFEKIKEIRSDIPVIICTGYSELINSATASSMGFSGYLVKPVMKSELARIVRNSLEKVPFE